MNSWFGKQPDEQMSSSDELDRVEVLSETDTPEESAGGVPATVEPGPSADGQLALLDQARHAIATAESMDEVKDIRDKAEAARKYAESASLGLEAQNYAAEVKLRAERKAGELIAQLKLHGGDRRSNDSDDRVTLEELGISKDQSSRWQLIARLPEKAFERHILGVKESATELTTSSVVKLARQLSPRKNPKPKVVDGGQVVTDFDELLSGPERFACIYADPPWQYDNRATRASADKHYPTMSLEDICALPVTKIAADDAHLHLWVTNGFLFDGPRVMESWGFEYKSCLIWVKPQMGIGNYWRVSHEFLLLGVRGSCKFRNKSSMSWVRANRTKHSRKPEKVRKLVERVSHGPYLELFAREAAKGWTAYGNELGE
jgi:N6-adenosine-specific RNA methylase IME4